MFNEELIKNLPAKIVGNEGHLGEMGQLLGSSSDGVGNWQVLLDRDTTEQVIKVFDLKNIEVEHPSATGEYQPLLEFLLTHVGLNPEKKKAIQELENQLLLHDFKGYLQHSSRKREKAKGFGQS